MRTIRSVECAKIVMVSAFTKNNEPVQFDINLDLRNGKYTITGYDGYGDGYLNAPYPDDDIAQFMFDLHEHAKMLLKESLRFKKIENLVQWKDLPREKPMPFFKGNSLISKIIKKTTRAKI